MADFGGPAIKFDSPELVNAAEEFYHLSGEISALKEQLKQKSARMSEMEIKLFHALEMADTKIGETETIIIKVKKLPFVRENTKYKEAFEWLFSRVNGAMKALVSEAIEANKTPSQIGPDLTATLKESFLSGARDKFMSVIKKIIGYVDQIQDANSKFEKFLNLHFAINEEVSKIIK